MIQDLLLNKNNVERANIKSIEIAKIGSLAKTIRKDYSIEIISINAINGGIEVFTKAWDKKGQIGFGRDGTIDIERFIIHNPPILIIDPFGTIINTVTTVTGEVFVTRYREDLKEALLQTIEHTIRVKKQKFDSSKIITNKIGNTTSTFYPDASAESTSVDGYSGYTTGVTTFATYRNQATGNDTNDSGTLCYATYLDQNDTNQVTYYIRSFYLFDTSSIPDGDDISSATLSIFGQGTTLGSVDGDIEIIATNPASNTAIVNGDYSKITRIAQAPAINIASWSNSAYNDFALNATGLSNVLKTGITKFGSILSHDLDDTTPTGSGNTRAFGYFSEQGGAGKTNDPKLVVEHLSPTLPSKSIQVLQAINRSNTY